jgi:hypothetical protein
VREFTTGLLSNSGVSLVGGIVLALLELALFAAFATPRHLAEVSPWLAMRHRRDDYARATILTLRMNRHAASGRLSVVYLGSSVAQRALYDSFDPKPIEKGLSFQTGAPVDFYSLYASSETIHEAELIAEYIPRGFRGVVTMVVMDDKDDEKSIESVLAQSPTLEERLALDPLDATAARLALAARTVPRTGIYFLDHLQFFSARREFLLHPWVVWTPYPRGGYHGRVPPPPGAEEKQLLLAFQRPHPLLDRTGDVLARLVEESKSRGATVVLIEAPQNPRYQKLKGPLHDQYETAITAFAREHGVAYWNFNPDLKFEQRDFEDAVHLGAPSKRLRFEQLYVKRVAELLRHLAGSTARPGHDHAAEHDEPVGNGADQPMDQDANDDD